MENSIINSLKRLERAGSENSKATEKLRDAAAEVAGRIVSQCGALKEKRALDLPRGSKRARMRA